MMYVPETKNESWVKRIPYPIPDNEGFRKGDDMNGVSNIDIYVHAIYFSYILLTHITIGDICAVNMNERILICFLIFLCYYVYTFLFVNITSMVTDLFGGLLSSFQQSYEETLQTIKADSLPPSLTTRIKQYFKYLWLNTGGLNDTFLSDLPVNLKADIYLEIYKVGINNSLLFKRHNNKFNVHAAASFLKLSTLEKYMKGDILVKAGSKSNRLFLLLDGKLMLIGIHKGIIGTVLPGVFLDTIPKEGTNRQFLHVVATKISTIAVISQKSFDMFLEVYPHVQFEYQSENEIIFKEYKEIVIPKLLQENGIETNLDKLLEDVFLL